MAAFCNGCAQQGVVGALQPTCLLVVYCVGVQVKGLRPQLFLSASHLINVLAGKAKAPSSRSSNCSVIPAAARDVITVFVMQSQELYALLHQQQQKQQGQDDDSGSGSGSNSSGSSTMGLGHQDALQLAGSSSSSSSDDDAPDAVQHRIEQLGLNMAVLTTFVRLLELKMIQMEGDEGTGARRQ
jgi:hypothetical protein